MIDILPIKQALVSVYDKTGLKSLAEFFNDYAIRVISTGKTAEYLKELKVKVVETSLFGGHKELLDGRIKTLTPEIYGGILFDRTNEQHCLTIKHHQIPAIDLVVVNFYPFNEAKKNTALPLSDLIEFIDIGGPSMLRAAAKNFSHVAALSSIDAYQSFISHYEAHQGTTHTYRLGLAKDAFAATTRYDEIIETTLEQRLAQQHENEVSTENPHQVITLLGTETLRYGENPHQKAHAYTSSISDGSLNLSQIKSLQGKQLSYNNLMDMHAGVWALRCLADKKKTAESSALVLKHGIPCGAAQAKNTGEAISLAIASDKKSAFGGVLIINDVFDASCIEALGDNFFEIIIAQDFSPDASRLLAAHKNLRLIPVPNLMSAQLDSQNVRTIFGGVLIQDQDSELLPTHTWTGVTRRKPTDTELLAMEFAFRVVKATPSNAITLAYKNQLIGVGAGQPNRVQSAEIAIKSAKERGFLLESAALASDAFIPFKDCLSLAYEHGITLIVQPGGALRDAELIAYADTLDMCMVFTHSRHFRH